MVGAPFQYEVFAESFTCWPAVHETNLYGPVPFGLFVPPTLPAAMSSDESIATFTPSSAAKIGTLGTESVSTTWLGVGVAIDAIVETFDRATAPVAVLRIRSSVAFTSAESKAVPSWNLTPVRSFKVRVLPPFEKTHEEARPG